MPEGETADWVAGSHDHSRVASRVGIEKIHIVNTVVLTLPGASISYYGEEIGMQDYRLFNINDNRDPNRTPMQWNNGVGAGFTSRNANETWLPIHPNYVAINVQAQREQPRSAYKYFQSLTSLRKTQVFREGRFSLEVINENVLAFTRMLDDEGYMVVINMAGSQENVNLSVFPSLNTELTVATAAPNSYFEVGQKVQNGNVTLGLYDAVVFSYVPGTQTEPTTSTSQQESTMGATTPQPDTTTGAESIVLSLPIIMIASIVALLTNKMTQ